MKFFLASLAVAVAFIQTTVAQEPKEAPSKVVVAYYEALNKNSSTAIHNFWCSEDLARLAAGSSIYRTERIASADAITKFHTLTKVEVVRENKQAPRASVAVKLHYKNGSVRDMQAELVAEKGVWKIKNN